METQFTTIYDNLSNRQLQQLLKIKKTLIKKRIAENPIKKEEEINKIFDILIKREKCIKN